MRLEGRVAVITGGASGIGRACAKRFAEEGADVVVADVNPERGADVVNEVKGSTNQRALFVPVDVTSEEDIEKLADAAMSEFGRIDCAVAAAGVSNAHYVSGELQAGMRDPSAGLLVNKALEDWKRVLDVNLTGVMLTDRALARRMIEAGNGGSLVNIASVAGKVPLAGAGDYCVSKAGVVMLTKMLAVELADRGIRVNAIGPGFIETPMTAGIRSTPEGEQRILAMTPMGRFGRPEEIANTALFLASDESSYFTGQTVFPSGGLFVG
ncbi:MAG: SDR family NAD(P)-dependent oxidoreductase [Gammaproteobacteria bacterium]|jgi:NAD(P)-dependent dehydrogenase (short-subunit alcohol dehydrogenase family)